MHDTYTYFVTHHVLSLIREDSNQKSYLDYLSPITAELVYLPQ